jgi:hypothetical protein
MGSLMQGAGNKIFTVKQLRELPRLARQIQWLLGAADHLGLLACRKTGVKAARNLKVSHPV